jgi:hypothetical protein
MMHVLLNQFMLPDMIINKNITPRKVICQSIQSSMLLLGRDAATSGAGTAGGGGGGGG